MDKIFCVSEIIFYFSPSVISHNRSAMNCDELRFMKTRPNGARINETEEICMELFFRTMVTTLRLLYTWEFCNSSNKFAVNLNMKGISSFLHSPSS